MIDAEINIICEYFEKMKVMRSITEALDGQGKPVKRNIPFGDSGRNKRRKAQNLKMRELAGANNGSSLWRFGLLNDNQNDNNDICETLTEMPSQERLYFLIPRFKS